MDDLILISRGIVDYMERHDFDGLLDMGFPKQYINNDCDAYFKNIIHIDKFLATNRTMEVDRTGSIEYPIKIKNIYPLPIITSETKNPSFEDVCLGRAQKLIDAGRQIRVAWSGGVDSTCLIVALLMCDIPKDQLFICGTYNSIHENPAFYKNVILKQNIPHKFYSMHSAVVEGFYDGNDLLVTGEAGDQLGVGQMSIVSTYDSDRWHRPYTETVSRKTLCGLEEHIQSANNYLPEPLETLVDLVWWGSFNMSIQHVCLRTVRSLPDRTNWKNNICHFYDSDEFQIWSILNRDKKIKDSIGSYKYTFKDLIYNYDGGEDYWKTKSKVISHREVYNLTDEYYLMFEDGTINYLKEQDL